MDEKTLIRSLQLGDTGAYEFLVKLHFQAIYHMAFRYMQDHGRTDDVVQETFVKAFRAIQSFRGDSTFKSWLMRIAINTAKNALRSKESRPTVDIDDLQVQVNHKDFANLERGQTAQLLKIAIDKLPPKQRQALELRIYEDLSFREIADLMEAPFDTAKANFRHAILNLRKILESTQNGQDLQELELAFKAMTEDDLREGH